MKMTDLLAGLDENGERFRRELSEEPTWRSLIEGTISLEAYLAVLKTLRDYYYVTPPYLRASAERLEQLAEDNNFRLWLPQYEAFIERFRDHANEEEHPEPHWEWAMADMAALGGWDYILDIKPYPPVQDYIGLYKAVAKDKPWATFGIAHPLEYISAGYSSRTAENLIRNSGIPNIKNAVRTLAGHGIDSEHILEYEPYLRSVTNQQLVGDILDTANKVRTLFVSYPKHFRPPRNILAHNLR